MTALNMTSAVTAVTATAPAKINLTLEVLGRRQDGFHDLRSLVAGVALCDRVGCRVRNAPGVVLSCSDPALESDRNLVVAAARALAARIGCEPSLEISLAKSIPVAGGLGGGSSDAATTLRLCNKLWNDPLSPAGLAAVGSELGSDVPLFFSLPSAVVTGRGEMVEPVALGWKGWALLVFTGTCVSTRDVYDAWRAGDGARSPSKTGEAIAAASTSAEITPLMTNHLEPAVFRVSKVVADAHETLNERGLRSFRVCGAGSTLFSLFDERAAACHAAGRIEEAVNGLTCAVVAAPVAPGPIDREES